MISHTQVGPSPGHSVGAAETRGETRHWPECPLSRKPPGHLSWRRFLLVVSGDWAPSLVCRSRCQGDLEFCSALWSRCRGEINEASAQGAGPLTCALIYHNSSAPPRLTQPRDWGGFRSDVDKAQKVHFSLTKSSQFSLVGGCRQVTGSAKGLLGVSGLRKGPCDPSRTWLVNSGTAVLGGGVLNSVPSSPGPWGAPTPAGAGPVPMVSAIRVCGTSTLSLPCEDHGKQLLAGPPPGLQERQPISRVPCPQRRTRTPQELTAVLFPAD